MKKIIFVMSLLLSTLSYAQFGINKTATSNKWIFGGYAGLGGAFGGSNSATTLYITPRVGYKLTDDLVVGLSGNFTWGNSRHFSTTMLGAGTFVNYYFQRTFYASTHFQRFFINTKPKSTGKSFASNESALYIGGGYMRRLGSNVYMQIGGMYNVLYKRDTSIFGGAFVPNIGIIYGL